LASNSLLEGLTFARFVFEDVQSIWSDLKNYKVPAVPSWRLGKAAEPDEVVVIQHLWDEIRRTMWNYVGIVRSDKRLARAEARVQVISQDIENYYWDVVPRRDLLEVRNLAAVAMLTVKSARLRKESRGIHHSIDYPFVDDSNFRKDTVLC
jgi:L-aspartate oxidase